MRTITKLSEPKSLTELRAKPGAVFDERGLFSVPPVEGGNPTLSKEAKQELRERLLEEQRGLCCYCCCRIFATEKGMRIEHWRSLTKYPKDQLGYWNLMAACPGNEGQKGSEHCDVLKKDQDLSRNPSTSTDRIDGVVSYPSNGEIRSSDDAFNSELGEVLNLNIAFLKNNRISVLDGFKAGLDKRGSLDRGMVERLLRRWEGRDGGALEPFSTIVVWWLKRKLQRL